MSVCVSAEALHAAYNFSLFPSYYPTKDVMFSVDFLCLFVWLLAACLKKLIKTFQWHFLSFILLKIHVIQNSAALEDVCSLKVPFGYHCYNFWMSIRTFWTCCSQVGVWVGNTCYQSHCLLKSLKQLPAQGSRLKNILADFYVLL